MYLQCCSPFVFQAKALYGFSSGADGELTFGDDEILTITRQVCTEQIIKIIFVVS